MKLEKGWALIFLFGFILHASNLLVAFTTAHFLQVQSVFIKKSSFVSVQIRNSLVYEVALIEHFHLYH